MRAAERHEKHAATQQDNAVSWPIVQIGEICDVQLGKMLSPKSKTGARPIPYLRNENVQWNRFDLADVPWMDFSEAEEAKFRLRPGDLLVCEGGEPGRAAIWQGQIERCCYQKALHRIRPRNGCLHPKFLMYYLWSAALERNFTGSHGKTTIAHLPREKLICLEIPLPSLLEQERIAAELTAALAAVDTARRATQDRLAAAEALSFGYIRESLKVPGVNAVRIGECLDEVRQGVGASWKNYPLIGATRSGLAPAKEGIGKQPERYKLVDRGTIFYNPMRILLGSIAMVDEDDALGITSPDYVVFRGRVSLLDSRWFYRWFRSIYGEQLILSLSRGAVRERILFNRLAEGEINVPPYEAQVEASRRILALNRTLPAMQQEQTLIETLQGALLRRTFNHNH